MFLMLAMIFSQPSGTGGFRLLPAEPKMVELEQSAILLSIGE